MLKWEAIKKKIKSFLARRFGTAYSRSNAYIQQGMEFEQGKEYDKAQLAFERAMVLNPNNPYAYYNLGVIYDANEDRVNAEKCYRRALELDGNLFHAAYNLGIMASENFRLDIAEKFLRIALRAEPNNVDCLIKLHELSLTTGDFPASVEMIRRARALQPDSELLIQSDAGLKLRMGKADEAYELLKPYLAKAHVHPAIAYAFSEIARAVGETQRGVDTLREVLGKSEELADGFKRALYYQLGSLLESQKQYHGAFDAYRRGATLFDKQYRRDLFERNISEIVECTTRENLEALPKASYDTEIPVFVVGTPRSGTTLAETILKSHPQVYGAGELANVTNMAYQLYAPPKTTVHDGLKAASPQRLNEFAMSYMSEIERRAGHTPIRAIDKMPGNFLQLMFIDRVFPGARVIHMRRNPIDACLSMFIQNFSNGHYYSFALEDLVHYYSWYQKVAENVFAELTIPVLEVNYEDMVSKPQVVIPKMVEFIGLEFDERCLHPEQHAGNVVTASHEQVRKPISPKSVGKWRHYRRHLEPLIRAFGTPQDIDEFEAAQQTEIITVDAMGQPLTLGGGARSGQGERAA